jgi:hypothetical protein
MGHSVRAAICVALLIAAAGLIDGCGLAPQHYTRLEEAQSGKASAGADARVAVLAAAELAKAEEALERARIARATLDDPAVVEHLSYVAKQRFAIARAAAEWRAAVAATGQPQPGASPP